MIGNPSHEPYLWWMMPEIGPALHAMPGSTLSCGCFIRRPDYEAILCRTHLLELNA